jgi:hypothetical protein
MRRAAALASLALALALGLPAAAEDADHVELEHVFVRITSGSLRPATLAVEQDQALGWLNYSNKIAKVSFDASVGKKLLCRSQGSFRLTGARLESGNIEVNAFASLCHLAPGEYEYQVELREGVGLGGTAAPELRTGKLVVQ